MKQAIVNKGDLKRIRHFFEHAKEGANLTIGYLGGSITQGASATDDTLCYAYRTFSWFQEHFPKSSFTYVNAGIGSTTSEYGVSRVEADLLAHRPDLIFVEYSVNDDNTIHFKETYEGLLRKILSASWNPAVCLIHNVRYDDGISAEQIHTSVGKYYELPSISLKAHLWDDIQSGQVDWHSLSADGLHPNNQGHELLANMIIKALNELLADKDEGDSGSIFAADLSINLPEALTENRFEHSCRIQNTSELVRMDGFEADMTPQNGVRDCFKNGWITKKEGATLRLTATCQNLAIVYRRTIQHPAQIAEAVIDGDFEHPIFLDANFDETWGDLICLQTLLSAKEHPDEGCKKHEIEIKIKKASEECPLPFYVVAIITAGYMTEIQSDKEQND